MAKITRDKLPRGVKLTIDHTIKGPLNSCDTQLQGEIDSANIKDDQAPFRLNFNLPFLKCIAMETGSDTNYRYKGAALIPFVLPPVQEFFDQDMELTKNTPIPVLDEFSFSFDQRSEAAAIIGPDAFNPDVNKPLDNSGIGDFLLTGNQWAGTLNFDQVGSNYGIQFVILEKMPTIDDTTIETDIGTCQEIFNLELPGTAFISKTEKLNPFILTDISKPLNPYKSYVLVVNPTNNYIPRAFVSLQISLRFKMQIMARDSGDYIQNIPSNHKGVVQDAASIGVAANIPAGDSQIEAEGDDGLQTNIERVDEVFVNKLHGGYNVWSDTPKAEHISDSAAYEVIAVPLFGGLPTIMLGAEEIDKTVDGVTYKNYVGNWMDWLPYLANTEAGGNNSYATNSRRIIPLVNSLCVHHVVLGCHVEPRFWDDMAIKVGVAMGTGMVGDDKGYQQIAYLQSTVLSKDKRLIDSVDGFKSAKWYDKSVQYFTTGNGETRLLNVPLVYPDGVANFQGTTYKTDPSAADNYETGTPIFVGRGYSQTEARVNIADGVNTTASMGVSDTNGAEQWIEVRLQMWGNDDWNDTDQNDRAIFYPGAFWVYIIGKKHLTKVDI